MKIEIISVLVGGMVLSACAAKTTNVGSLVLPTSNRAIDVVQHRSDSRGCTELVVLQTYDAMGGLIDSQAGRGQSLPCLLTEVVIESGSRVGSAAIIARGMVAAAKATKPDLTNISNTNQQGQVQAQGQGQTQNQGQGQSQGQGQTAQGSVGGNGGQGGNNGQGNGDGDGGNPGTDNHHDNGDNN